MTKFKGITNEYRATDEYKEMMKFVQSECPGISQYFAEIAITLEKSDPSYIKSGKKLEKDLKKEKPIKGEAINTVINAVNIYDENHPDIINPKYMKVAE